MTRLEPVNGWRILMSLRIITLCSPTVGGPAGSLAALQACGHDNIGI